MFLFLLAVASPVPISINTWPWPNATARAWAVISAGGSALDAMTEGCSICEEQQCDGSVGYGGSPDEVGETTLDAMIMDGTTMDVGAVADLRRVKDAARAARLVLEHTSHTLLAGDQATQFALEMGLQETNLTTAHSHDMWTQWQANDCQPNFRVDVTPDPSASCGPYKPLRAAATRPTASAARRTSAARGIGPANHDTIAMVTIDRDGHLAAGTSTNGATNKVPGRVGDAPIAGAGAYGESAIGGCGATGDGDQMMRLLPTFFGVARMAGGATPKEAAEAAIARVAQYYPTFWGAVFCVNLAGEHGGAANIGTPFKYTGVSPLTGGAPQIVTVSSG